MQAEDGIRDYKVTGVQTCALPISSNVQLGQVRDLGVERIHDPEFGVGEVGHRVAVVAIPEEPASEFVDHRGPEDMEVRSEERRVGKGRGEREWTDTKRRGDDEEGE